MADVKIGPARPATSPEFEAANGGFGPDFSRTPDKEPPPKDPPKVNQKNPPKAASSVFGKLGTNKRLRSPVRKLTREAASDNELSDLERLEGWYRTIGSFARPFHPKFATAMESQANECAVAWFGLAENNDSVRRWILACIEGGDWGKVIGAHAPIVMAVIPETVLEKFFLKGMGMFARQTMNGETEDTMRQFSEGMGRVAEQYRS